MVAQALDLEPDHSLALAIDGLVCAYINKDMKSAAQRYEASIHANPSESLAWLFQSACTRTTIAANCAVECALRAQRLSPLDPMKYYYDNFTSTAMLSANDFEGAIRLRQAVAACQPHAWADAAHPGHRAGPVRSRSTRRARTVAEMLVVEPHFTVPRFLDRYPGRSRARMRPAMPMRLRDGGLPE